MFRSVFSTFLLWTAFSAGHIAWGCSDAYDQGTSYPLHAACAANQFVLVQRLVESGRYDINALDVVTSSSLAQRPLHIAIRSSSPTIVRYLLQAGADPNAPELGGNGSTPMHLLAYSRPELLPEAVEHYGGDLNMANRYGDTPFHFAAYARQLDSLRYCLDSGAQVVENKAGMNPLHAAINGMPNTNHAAVMLLAEHIPVDHRALGLAWRQVTTGGSRSWGFRLMRIWTMLRLYGLAYPGILVLMLVATTTLFVIWIRRRLQALDNTGEGMEPDTTSFTAEGENAPSACSPESVASSG